MAHLLKRNYMILTIISSLDNKDRRMNERE